MPAPMNVPKRLAEDVECKCLNSGRYEHSEVNPGTALRVTIPFKTNSYDPFGV